MKDYLKSTTKIMILLSLCIFIWANLPLSMVSARSKLEKGDFTYLDSYGEDVSFTLNRDAVVLLVIDVKLSDSDESASSKDGIRVEISGESWSDDEYEFSDDFNFRIGKGYTSNEVWYFPEERLKAGNYDLEISSLTSEELDIDYTIYTYNDFADTAKIQSTVSLKTDEEKAVSFKSKTPDGSFLGAQCKSSNSNIAFVWFDAKKEAWYVYGVSQGKCKITIKLSNGKKYICNVSVKNPAPKMLYSNITLCTTDSIKTKLLYSSGKVKWSSSNSKIASVNKDGRIKAKGIGRCTITAKYKGKSYKTKVKVVRQNPNFTAYLTEYNTRNNYFKVKIWNYSNKPITIYSKGAYSMDNDYKVYDRKLKLYNGKSSIVIPARKIMSVKFKIIGGNTWPDFTDHTVRFYFSFDKKKYLGSVWYNDSSYKRQDGWYTTYWTN